MKAIKFIIIIVLMLTTSFSYSQSKKISELPAATDLNTNIDFVGVQGGVTKKISDSLLFPSLTSGSVLFSNGTTIAQDNSNLFWDNTNKRLGIGTEAQSAGCTINSSLGAELAPSLSAPNWTLNAGWAYGVNSLVRTSAGGYRVASTIISFSSGTTYKVVITATVTNGGFQTSIGSISSLYDIVSSGTFTFYITSHGGNSFLLGATTDGSAFTISYLSIKAIDSSRGLVVTGPAKYNSTIDLSQAAILGKPLLLPATGSSKVGFYGPWSPNGYRSIIDVAANLLTLGDENYAVSINGSDALELKGGALSVKNTSTAFTGGNIALGTTTPNISGYSGTGLTINSPTVSTYSWLEMQGNETGTNGTTNVIVFRNLQANARMSQILVGNDGALTSGYIALQTLRLGTLTEAIRILGNGKVGIGTTTPTAPLQVVGLVEYADNATALAAGLTAGAFYRTGDLLKVVH